MPISRVIALLAFVLIWLVFAVAGMHGRDWRGVRQIEYAGFLGKTVAWALPATFEWNDGYDLPPIVVAEEAISAATPEEYTPVGAEPADEAFALPCTRLWTAARLPEGARDAGFPDKSSRRDKPAALLFLPKTTDTGVLKALAVQKALTTVRLGPALPPFEQKVPGRRPDDPRDGPRPMAGAGAA